MSRWVGREQRKNRRRGVGVDRFLSTGESGAWGVEGDRSRGTGVEERTVANPRCMRR